RLLAENRKRVEVGAMAPLDEKQAESQVAASKAALLITQRALSERENALKNLLTDDYVQWHEITLLPAESLMAVPAIFDLQESWKKGLSLRPDLLQTRLDLDRTDINLRLDRNQLFPQLDVIGRYGFAGQGSEFSRTFGKIGEGSNPFYLYGAELSIPLGNRAARQSYNISKAQKEQAKLLLKKKEQDILVEIDNAVKVAQTNLERVEATRQARLYAEAALEAEQKKLENGKSTSFFVLQLQRDLTARRSDEIRSLADYNNALAQLALVEGSVLERNRLSLDFK
ncbi:MAG: TolC family protein, partial [Verrucomicrobiota bacterium]